MVCRGPCARASAPSTRAFPSLCFSPIKLRWQLFKQPASRAQSAKLLDVGRRDPVGAILSKLYVPLLRRVCFCLILHVCMSGSFARALYEAHVQYARGFLRRQFLTQAARASQDGTNVTQECVAGDNAVSVGCGSVPFPFELNPATGNCELTVRSRHPGMERLAFFSCLSDVRDRSAGLTASPYCDRILPLLKSPLSARPPRLTRRRT